MGQPVSRLGDHAYCPLDTHGCPSCPHPVFGPSISGSPDVIVNGQPVLRVGDVGIHRTCCSEGQWVAVEGSAGVFFNDLPVVRQGDETMHCGGTGVMIQGSANVSIGDIPEPMVVVAGFILPNLPDLIRDSILGGIKDLLCDEQENKDNPVCDLPDPPPVPPNLPPPPPKPAPVPKPTPAPKPAPAPTRIPWYKIPFRFPIPRCWIAAAIYGEDSEHFHYARLWITEGWHGTRADLVRALYGVTGPFIAALVREIPLIKRLLKPLFDRAVVRGQDYARRAGIAPNHLETPHSRQILSWRHAELESSRRARG